MKRLILLLFVGIMAFSCTPEDGVDGINGQDGISCWDLNGDGNADANEDTNGDGEYNGLDCQGKDGADGVVNYPEISTERPATEQECEFGGTAIDFGTDSNLNRVVDPSEVDSTILECDDEQPLYYFLSIEDFDGNNEPFPLLWKRIYYYLDSNFNLVQDSGEETLFVVYRNDFASITSEVAISNPNNELLLQEEQRYGVGLGTCDALNPTSVLDTAVRLYQDLDGVEGYDETFDNFIVEFEFCIVGQTPN